MLSTVNVKAGDKTHAMKLGSRAMMAVERETGEGILATLGKMQGDAFSVVTLHAIAKATMNDGRGGSDDDAHDMIDALGVAAATQELVRVIEGAFPQAEAEADGAAASGKGKPAGKKTNAG